MWLFFFLITGCRENTNKGKVQQNLLRSSFRRDKKILAIFHDKLQWEWSTFLLFVTYSFCFRLLGLPSSDSRTISRWSCGAWLFLTSLSSCNKLRLQDTFSPATLIAITTHDGSWFLPGRFCNGTRRSSEKSLKSKRNPSDSCDSTCQQTIPFRLSCGNSVLQWPYNLPSYAFICYIRWNFRTGHCRHPALGECSCDICALNLPAKETMYLL